MNILHVITGLTVGGAEMALCRLLPVLKSKDIDGEVISLTDVQPLGEKIRALGFRVDALHARPGFPDPRLVSRLSRLIRERQPHLVQTWMYHADLIGGLSARLVGVPVVWGIHHTISRRGDLRPGTHAVARLDALLSGPIPVRIICCAESSRQTHAAIGYNQQKMVVISNGFDLAEFRPDAEARRSVRTELGLSPEVMLIGHCARFDPQKDHGTLIRAAGFLSRKMPRIHFVLWGKDVDLANDLLGDWIAAEDLQGQVHLLGLRPDSPRLAAALDVSTLSSSYGEAFPLVVGEAMACAVPCVVTEVGDAAHIVGETGRSVPPGSPEALAAAWGELLSLPAAERQELGSEARKRIEVLFSLEKMGAAYAGLYRDIIGDADSAHQ